jgi:energy-coupling factor transport system substrate-specific component
MSDARTPTSTETLDELAADLQQLRTTAGQVAYGEIAARIERRRAESGHVSAAARIGRSSVYDVFRAGRTRMNAHLVAEIVIALGCSDDEAVQWRERCLRANAAQHPARARSRTVVTPTIDPVLRSALVVLLMISCLGLNLFGHNVAGRIPVTLYLDMIGTAISAMVLGPWYGVTVGVTTNTLAAISNVPGSIAFVLVQAAGALVWGYGVRAWRLARTPLRYLLLNVIAALVCSVVAVPVIVMVFGGFADHPADLLTTGFESLGEELWAAVFTSNVLVSLADKLLAGAIALAVLAFLHSRLDPGLLTPNPPRMWFSSGQTAHSKKKLLRSV